MPGRSRRCPASGWWPWPTPIRPAAPGREARDRAPGRARGRRASAPSPTRPRCWRVRPSTASCWPRPPPPTAATPSGRRPPASPRWWRSPRRSTPPTPPAWPPSRPPPWVGFNRRFDPGAAAVRAAVPADGDVDLRLEIGYRRAELGRAPRPRRRPPRPRPPPDRLGPVDHRLRGDRRGVRRVHARPGRARPDARPGPGDAASPPPTGPTPSSSSCATPPATSSPATASAAWSAAVRGRLGRSGPHHAGDHARRPARGVRPRAPAGTRHRRSAPPPTGTRSWSSSTPPGPAPPPAAAEPPSPPRECTDARDPPVRRRQRVVARPAAADGRLPDARRAARPRRLARARRAGHAVRGRRPAHALQRRRAGRARALLPVPVVGRRSAGPLHGRLRRPRRRSGSGWAPTARARWPSTPTRAARPPRRRPARSSAGGSCTTGWCCSRWSAPGDTHRRLERLFGPPEPVDEVFGRHTVARCSACAAACSAHRPGWPTPPALLLAEQPFDLAWLTFCAAHVAGHQFWDLSQLDADDLDADAEQRARRHPRATCTRPSTPPSPGWSPPCPRAPTCMVVSPVGMDVNTSRADLLPEMLRAILEPGADARPVRRARSGGCGPPCRAGCGPRWPSTLPERQALDLTARLEMRGVDWSRTRAFAHPAENQGYVRLNLHGRERDGIVHPDDADALLDEIADGLRTLRRPRRLPRRRLGRPGGRHVRHRRTRPPAARPHRPVDGAARHAASRACGPSGSGRSCATASAAGDRGTTPRGTPGRSWSRGRPGRSTRPGRRGSRTSPPPPPPSSGLDTSDMAGEPLLQR